MEKQGLDIRNGERKLIAEMTGYSLVSVRSQLKGVRRITPKVKEAAEKIIENRNNLVLTINNVKL
jgi:hypothetical protein